MILKFTPNFTSRIHGLFADTEYVLSAVTKPIIKEKGNILRTYLGAIPIAGK